MSTNGQEGNGNKRTEEQAAGGIGGNVSGAGPSPESEPGSVTAGRPAPPPGKLTKADFTSDQEVRWCPGCGDYAILNNVQKVMPELGIPREKIVFVSGIGCSSRFPYYMNTYGFHTIHGRAPAIATGIKASNPDLSVWVITGDGDALSIGGNHFMHAIRRNLDLNYILFNNRIYGLTKGQYSPTSEFGKKTKSTPMGVIDYPVNPLSLAIASGVLYLEHGKPMVFGKDRDKGIRMNGTLPEVIQLGSETGLNENDCLVHDSHEKDPSVAFMLARMEFPSFPQPVGIFRDVQRDTYEDLMAHQIEEAVSRQGRGQLQKLIHSGDMWVVD
ncbi:MAG: 2-oxoacid:ferredoxin oxidoreductase subunit beta [Acidobacteria bacterium]|nr:MAG: 2-oxoacid:ferredoxin oxidoreductase subunit beta [Acidobacteriota bacterium]